MSKKLGLLVALAVMLSSFSLVITAGKAHAAKCKPVLVSQGKWTNYLAAKSSARVHWRRAAKRMYGRRYAKWFRKARSRRYQCRKKGYLRRCYAAARPCR